MPRITSITQRQLTATASDQLLYKILSRLTFITGTGFEFNSTVNAITLQPDGKILVGGDFTTYNGVVQYRITRLNSDGTLDTGFNSGAGFNSTVNAITLQPDGKILVGGEFTTYNGFTRGRIARLKADGTRDTSFGVGVGTGFNTSAVLSIVLQPDGKILAAGGFSGYNGTSQNYITRLNSDGTLDTGFNSGTGFGGPDPAARVITLQPDGKILVGGDFTTYNGVAQNRITRLNSDGTRDTGFDSGTGFSNPVRKIVLQPDGKILVGGVFSTYNGVTVNRIVRLNTDGTRDTGFSTEGTGFGNIIHAIALQSDGKLLVGGEFTTYNGIFLNRIQRLNADGTRDTGFVIGTGFNNIVYTIVSQSDGNILVGGLFTSYNGNPRKAIVRLTSSGQIQSIALPVSTYTVVLPYILNTGTGFNNSVRAIALQPDGKILVDGEFTTYNGVTVNRIVRLNTDGTRDPGFVSGTGLNQAVFAIALQPDGKILVAGSVSSYNGVYGGLGMVRLNADGTFDTGFSIGSGFNATPVYAITIQPDGKILVGGRFTGFNGTSQSRITRLNADGTRDTGFSIGTGFTGGYLDLNAIVLQPDGKILAGGNFTSYNGVIQNHITRLNTDGTLDTGFTGGVAPGLSGLVQNIALQSDGKILVGGNFNSYNGTSQSKITRLNADGTRDTGFSIGTGFNGDPQTIVLQPDGKILVGGNFNSYNGVTQYGITRLNSDGSRDTSFVIGTGFTSTGGSVVYAITLQPNGKILVGGDFTAYNGVTENRIILLNTDGSSAKLDNVNEGSPYNFVVNTANVSDSTVLRWRVLDRGEDFAVNTGTVTITANSGAFSVTPTVDQSTEGSETFRVQVEKLSGTVLLTTGNITINDTSTS
jgi:uncharacterized delta-60 repeat protein